MSFSCQKLNRGAKLVRKTLWVLKRQKKQKRVEMWWRRHSTIRAFWTFCKSNRMTILIRLIRCWVTNRGGLKLEQRPYRTINWWKACCPLVKHRIHKKINQSVQSNDFRCGREPYLHQLETNQSKRPFSRELLQSLVHKVPKKISKMRTE